MGQVAELEKLVSGSEEERQAYLEPRHVVDVLADFHDARLSPEGLLRCLRPLQPRLYSISSSPLEGAGRVQASPILQLSSFTCSRPHVSGT